MTSQEIETYIGVRNGELSSDEILRIIDVSRNPSINHIIFENGTYVMWDINGTKFNFKMRTWH